MKNSSRRNFLKSSSLGTIGLMGAAKERNQTQTSPLKKPLNAKAKSKRDLMEDVLQKGSKSDYVPAGFFMHFNKKGDEAVKAHMNYFKATQMDFVKIQFDGMSLPLNEQIKTAKDWYKQPIMPESFFEPILYVIKNLVKEAKSEAMIIQTLYSPYQMAKQAVPWELLVKHVKEDPEAVCRGMENVTLSILNFVQAAAKLGVDGFYTCAQGGETNRVADYQLFNRAIKSFDMLLYKEVSQLVPYNILHICDYDGEYEGFTPRFQDYPGQIVNIPLQADGKVLTLQKAAEIFDRPVMGGLDRHGVISTGTVDQVKKATLDVLKNAPNRVILSANCTVSNTTPIENLRAAIQTAHEFRKG